MQAELPPRQRLDRADLLRSRCVRYDIAAMIPERRPEFEPLRETLRRRRTNAFIADAELIRDAPDSEERQDEARRTIRNAMLLFALRKITRAERDRILDILSFATITEPTPEPEPPLYRDLDYPEAHGPVP